jgi:hypothetical protein
MRPFIAAKVKSIYVLLPENFKLNPLCQYSHG